MNEFVEGATLAMSWKLVASVAVLTVVASTASAIVTIVRALGAKERARGRLHAAAQSDQDLRRMVERASAHRLSSEDVDLVRAKIEAHIRHLSARDQMFVREGLQQSSPRGVQRFVSGVLSRA